MGRKQSASPHWSVKPRAWAQPAPRRIKKMPTTEEQRVAHCRHQATYRKRHPEIVHRWQKQPGIYAKKSRWLREHHPEKVAAWLAINRALASGKLVRPNRCSRCKKKCKPEAHHPDYKKKLEVIWLCGPCHWAEHGKGV